MSGSVGLGMSSSEAAHALAAQKTESHIEQQKMRNHVCFNEGEWGLNSLSCRWRKPVAD